MKNENGSEPLHYLLSDLGWSGFLARKTFSLENSGFLKTTDQPTTNHLPTDHPPPTTDQPITDQVHQPPTNRPSTNKKYEDQKFHNKF